MKQEDVLIETYNYRGFSFPVYKTTTGEYYTIAEAKVVPLPQDYRKYIDSTLDTEFDLIVKFMPNAWLEYFDNGGHKDVRCKFNGRIVKVFLVESAKELSDSLIRSMIAESTKTINKLTQILARNIIEETHVKKI